MGTINKSLKLRSLLKYYNRLFVVWVTLGSFLAFFYPMSFVNLKGYMDLFFALTMFGIGAVLQKNDFKNILKHIWVVIVGVVCQFTIMPFGSYMISKLMNLHQYFSVGLILTGSAPGAMASNVFSYLANADVAYSVSLTTTSTLLSPILTPFLTYLLAHQLLDIPFFDMFLSVIKMVVLPLLAGFFIRNRYEKNIQKLLPLFPALSITFIVFICALVIALNKTYIIQMNRIIFFAVLTLNIIGLICGYLVATLFRFDILKKKALSIEIGMQNAGLGSVLALKHFNEKVAIPAVIFVFVCIFTASILTQIWQRKD